MKGPDEGPFFMFRFASNAKTDAQPWFHQFVPLEFAPREAFAFEAWPIFRSYFSPLKKTWERVWLPFFPGFST